MKLGILSGVGGATVSPPTLEDQIQEVVTAEADGFDSWWSTHAIGADALTLLALAGQRTQRIELGTGVVPLRLPRHPVTMAQQALTTQAAAGGRLVLGLGAPSGASMEEWGLASAGSPGLLLREYLTVLRTLVTDGAVDFQGHLFRAKAQLRVPDATPLPIMIAALGPVMLRVAGELSDGTVTWMVGPKTLGTHIVPRISAAAESAGRPIPRICAGVPVAVTDDPAAARAAATTFDWYGDVPHYRRMLDIEGVDGPADVAVTGSEAEVGAQLRSYADAGASDLLASVFPVGDDAEASISRTHVLLKSLVGKI